MPGATGLILLEQITSRSIPAHRQTAPDRMWSRWSGCSATRTEPCHVCRMFTYDVTAAGPLGLLTEPHPRGISLIGDFGSLQDAEAFADKMRVIDADRSHSAWSHHAEVSPPATRSASAAFAGSANHPRLPALSRLTTLTGCWTGWSGWHPYRRAAALRTAEGQRSPNHDDDVFRQPLAGSLMRSVG